MKNLKLYLIILGTTLLIFIGALVAYLVLTPSSKTGEVDFDKLSKAEQEKVELAHQSYEIDGLDIKQIDFNHYDLVIKFKDKDNNNYNNVNFYISKMEEDLTEETKLDIKVNQDGNYEVDSFYISERGDYYLTATFDVDGIKLSSVLPITFPKMNPKIYINNGLNNLMFEIDGKTSWSSFIDPEGINLYRSSDYIFNEKAKLIQQDLRITVQEYLDPNTTSEEPYYFLKLSGKEGRVNFLTRALFGEVEQSDFKARFVEDVLEDILYLELTGSMKGPEKDNNLATRHMRLRVGNWPNTTMVENSYNGDDNSKYKFLINLKDNNLVKSGSNDMVIFYTENGTMLEASIDASLFDIASITRNYQGNKIYLSRPNALMVHKDLNITTNNLKASFIKEGDIVYLEMSGQIYLKDPLKVEKLSIYIQNIGSKDATIDSEGKFSVKIDLKTLPISAHWNDMRFSFTEEGTAFNQIDLKASIIEKSEPFVDGAVTYEFQSWNDQLKLHKHN